MVNELKSFLGSIPISNLSVCYPLCTFAAMKDQCPFQSTPLSYLLRPPLSFMYYEQLVPETKRLHIRCLPVNRNPFLHPLPLILPQEGKDAARLPSYLFCSHALR